MWRKRDYALVVIVVMGFVLGVINNLDVIIHA